LDLPEEVQTLIQKGDITVGHAKVLLSLKDGDETLKLAKSWLKGIYQSESWSNFAKLLRKTTLPRIVWTPM